MGNGFLVYFFFLAFAGFVILLAEEGGEGIGEETPLLRCATGSSEYSEEDRRSS